MHACHNMLTQFQGAHHHALRALDKLLVPLGSWVGHCSTEHLEGTEKHGHVTHVCNLLDCKHLKAHTPCAHMICVQVVHTHKHKHKHTHTLMGFTHTPLCWGRTWRPGTNRTCPGSRWARLSSRASASCRRGSGSRSGTAACSGGTSAHACAPAARPRRAAGRTAGRSPAWSTRAAAGWGKNTEEPHWPGEPQLTHYTLWSQSYKEWEHCVYWEHTARQKFTFFFFTSNPLTV